MEQKEWSRKSGAREERKDYIYNSITVMDNSKRENNFELDGRHVLLLYAQTHTHTHKNKNKKNKKNKKRKKKKKEKEKENKEKLAPLMKKERKRGHLIEETNNA